MLRLPIAVLDITIVKNHSIGYELLAMYTMLNIILITAAKIVILKISELLILPSPLIVRVK